MNGVVERTELITPEPAEALARILDVPPPDLNAGDDLPLLWHWLYNLERPRTEDLGTDGHPVRGTVPMPPARGLRRMWAGGRVRSLCTLRSGELATRRTQILATQEKRGKNGPLTFVTVGHRIFQAGRLAVDERQDVVYRAASGRAPTKPRPHESEPCEQPLAPDEWRIDVTTPLLFQFSALTYNAHRIHYDGDYARNVEGYAGLVVHGPLQAIIMAEAARAKWKAAGPGQVVDYRLVAPLLQQDGLITRATSAGEAIHTSIRDRFGRETARGTITGPVA